LGFDSGLTAFFLEKIADKWCKSRIMEQTLSQVTEYGVALDVLLSGAKARPADVANPLGVKGLWPVRHDGHVPAESL
jgi:hypothetical protein